MKTDGVWFCDEVRMARYIVELTKLGAAYTVEDYGDGWIVKVTGF